MSEKITAADAIRLLDAHEAAAVDVREPDVYKRQVLRRTFSQRTKLEK